MNKKLIAFGTAISLAFTACSSNSTSSPAVDANTPISGATITQSTLDANYKATLTEAEIKADLVDISTKVDGDMIGSVLESNPMENMSMLGGGLGKKTLAKVAANPTFDANGCMSMDTDTTYTLAGMKIVDSLKVTDSKGAAFKFCMSSIDMTDTTGMSYMSLYNDANFLMVHNATSDSVEMYSRTNMTMNFTETSISYHLDGTNNMNILKPSFFNMYMTFDMNMSLNMSALNSDEEVSESPLTGSMTLWFMNGTYKCTLDLSTMSESTSCDLMHNGTKIGVLSSDEEGNMIVLDANGTEM